MPSHQSNLLLFKMKLTIMVFVVVLAIVTTVPESEQALSPESTDVPADQLQSNAANPPSDTSNGGTSPAGTVDTSKPSKPAKQRSPEEGNDADLAKPESPGKYEKSGKVERPGTLKKSRKSGKPLEGGQFIYKRKHKTPKKHKRPGHGKKHGKHQKLQKDSNFK